MAPQATLTFTPSIPPSTVRDPFDLNSLGSFASLWPFRERERERPHSDSVVPLEPSHSPRPVPPTLTVTGNFSLLKGGAIQVGQVRVGIERGTFVGRCTGLGETGTESRGLWWLGFGSQGEKGVWILQLLRATDHDATAVHRLLLYLPPQPFPSQSPAPYRNSLLLYDDQNQRIVSVLPLDYDRSRRPRAARGPLPLPPHCDSTTFSKPLPRIPSLPTSTALSPGAKMAQYVDRVVKGIHPDQTPEALSSTERLEQARIRRQASREERDWDPFMLAEVLLAPPSASSSTTSRNETVDETLVSNEEEEEEARNQDSPISPSSVSPLTHATRSRISLSQGSLSSLATFGTERFVTADEFDQEGDDEEEASRRSSFASVIAEGSHFVDHSLSRSSSERPEDSHGSSLEDEQDSTPTPSTFVGTSVHVLQSSSSSLDSIHTITNGNAVLLSFLGAPSSLPSPSTRIRVSTHLLSEAQVSEQLDLGAIRPAKVELEKGHEAQGWLDWLSSLLRLSETGAEGEGASRGWFSWITLCLSSSSSPCAPARQLKTAQGGTASRLSVLYVDGEGRGSRVYVS
ncbi:hypothetical protein JCM5350_003767 [Sporobolomyces pararoseus]